MYNVCTPGVQPGGGGSNPHHRSTHSVYLVIL